MLDLIIAILRNSDYNNKTTPTQNQLHRATCQIRQTISIKGNLRKINKILEKKIQHSNNNLHVMCD
jgi:hypothetical protein